VVVVDDDLDMYPVMDHFVLLLLVVDVDGGCSFAFSAILDKSMVRGVSVDKKL